MIKKYILGLFLFVNLFLVNVVFGQSVGDYRSNVNTTGIWEVSSSWEYYNGSTWVTATNYPGQVAGAYAVLIQAGDVVNIGSSGIATLAMGTLTISGSLVLTGINTGGTGTNFFFNTQNMIVTPLLGTISFINKVNLKLPTNATLQVEYDLTPNPDYYGLIGDCNHNQDIVIGSSTYAYCNGGGSTGLTFYEVMDGGGTLNSAPSSNSPICTGETLMLYGSYIGPVGNGITYSWSITNPNNIVTTSSIQNPTINNAISGIYAATLTCSTVYGSVAYSNSETISVTVNPLPTITGTLNVCEGSTTTLIGSDAANATTPWTSATTAVATVSSSGVVTGVSAGTSVIAYMNSNGCTKTATVTVRSLVNNVGSGFSGSSFCAGEQATITFDANNLSGVYPYTLVYRNDTTNATESVVIANDDATAFNVVPNPTSTTDYTLISITDANGCVRTTDFGDSTARVTINSLPTTPIVGAITQPTCSVAIGSVALSGLPSSGTWTLTQSGTSSATITGTGTGTTISGLVAGTYNFTVTNASGCTSLASANVVINAQPGTPGIPIIDSYTLPIFGSDGTVTLKNLPSGNWELNQIKDGVTTTISGSGSSYTLTNLSDGSYEFEVSEVCTSARSNSLILVYYIPIVNSAAANCNGFVASWSAVPTATKYLLDVSTVNDFSSFVGAYHDFDVGNVLSHTLTGLQTGGALYYRIRAMNSSKITLHSATITVSPLVTNTYSGTWDNGMPTSNQNIVFNSAFSSTGDIEACNCTVTNNGNVTFNSGHTLKITNWVHVNGGSLTFENAASLVQINNVVNTGNITYKRMTSARNTDYTYWSTPVSPLNLAGVGGISYSPMSLAGSMFYSYLVTSTTEDWKSETAGTTMVVGQAYSIRGPGAISINPPSLLSVSFTGVPNNGDYSIPVVNANASYLLGNPYPSAIDADDFLDYNSGVLDGTIYFWTHNTQIGTNVSNPGTGVYAYSSDDYASYNFTGGVGTKADSDLSTTPIIPNGKIAAGQGFFASSNAIGTIRYNNSMRISGTTLADGSGSNQQFFKTRNPKEKVVSPIKKNRVWLNLTNTQGAFKQTLVGYITDATNGYDSRFDGESFDGNEFVDFYSINDDKNLTIQGRALPFDGNDEVPLGFRTTISGAFTINIDQADGVLANQPVFIEDKLTNTISDLKSGNYTFTTVAGTFNDRFVLRYKDNTSDKILSVDETEANDGIIVLYSNNYKTLIIRNNMSDTIVNSVTLFNMLGQKITHWDIKEREQTSIQIPIKNVSPEIYIVKVKTTKGETSKRIIIR